MRQQLQSNEGKKMITSIPVSLKNFLNVSNFTKFYILSLDLERP